MSEKAWFETPPPAKDRRGAFRSFPNETIQEIRLARWQFGWTTVALARRMDVSYNAMRAIVEGRTYKDAGGPTGKEPKA